MIFDTGLAVAAMFGDSLTIPWPRGSAPPSAAPPVGLLAGSGRFPIVFAEKARHLGLRVVCVGIRHEASPDLAPLVERFYWAGVSKLGRIIRCFRRERVQRIVMAGKVSKSVMYTPWRVLQLWPDFRTCRFWFRQWKKDFKDDSLMLGIINEFRRDGMDFDSALNVCPELLVKPGLLTRRGPSRGEEQDIDFGWELAKEMGRLDVGQSVAVKERAVLAVEAIEGTDRAILRAGELCPMGGFTVVKVAKPQQDMRFDVPTIGPQTMENLHKAGGRVLAIEAHKTIVLDHAETIALANRYAITILAR